MAWTTGCSGNSNDELVKKLYENQMFTKSNILDAMLKTDRSLYCPPTDTTKTISNKYQYGPYADAPQSIGYKVTISAPYIHAQNLELLHDQIIAKDSKILDVGCGSGILLGYMARMCSKSSTIVGIEVVKELVEMSKLNLTKDGFVLDDDSHNHCKIIIRHGDGWIGKAEYGPYDAINVGAGALKIPEELINQLKPDGVLLIPIGTQIQSTQILTKFIKRCHTDGSYTLEETALREVRFVPLVEDETIVNIDPVINWDQRYKKGWAYGYEPNKFLVESAVTYLPTNKSLNILSLGEGQGRNAVYLATLGHNCIAIDCSDVGLNKARNLSKKKSVSHLLTTITTDINEFNFEINKYDVIISIFCMFPKDIRKNIHSKCINALKPNGIVIIECFSLKQNEIRLKNSNNKSNSKKKYNLGPSLDCLVSWEELYEDFIEFDLIVGQDCEKILKEGNYHQGEASCSQFIARKKSDLLDITAKKNNLNEVIDSNNNIIINNKEIELNDSYKNSIDIVFSSTKDGSKEYDVNRELDDNEDRLLISAPISINISCNESIKTKWCKYCWCPSTCCICDSVDYIIKNSIINQQKYNIVNDNNHFHWIIIIHPSEFLRSTSTVKIAAKYLSNTTNNSCELLVYGNAIHMNRLNEILKNNESSFILFPDDNDVEDNNNNCNNIKDNNNNYKKKNILSVEELINKHKIIKTYESNESNKLNELNKLNIIVPDGSWECAKALVREIRKQVTSLQVPCVSLDMTIVSIHHSTLIEALKEGQGLGRISTLEAIAIFLKQSGNITNYNDLIICLQPLVNYININFNSNNNMKTNNNINNSNNKLDIVNENMNNCLNMLLNDLKDIPFISIPYGLRRCNICCENLATHSRMQLHIKGKKHCNEIINQYYCSNESKTVLNLSPNIEEIREIYQKYSTDVISTYISEPPDVAIASLKDAISSNKKNISNDNIFTNTKGERELNSTALPNISEELPNILRNESIINYDINLYDLYNSIKLLLFKATSIGHFSDINNPNLEEFIVKTDIFRNFKARQVLYNTVSNDINFLTMYENLVKDIICPYIKNHLIDSLFSNKDQKLTFYYQFPPTLRLQPSSKEEFGRIHRDLEYGHQSGEINFWMPLTDFNKTNTTLWAETSPFSGDFHPFNINYSEIQSFHGSLCRHYAPTNPSDFTRVSIDFRIGIDKYFDPNWELKGLKGKHGRKKFIF